VPVRHGRVLLACDAVHDRVVLEEISRRGLDCQLVHNRSALMILPSGVTKGTGLLEGLAELGLSRHSTLAVGDAENDHSLLQAAEVAAAVGDAVESLKETADLVLHAPNGDGVRELLAGPILSGRERVHSRRWEVKLGLGAGDRPFRIPASQINVLVIGGSGAGKSFVSGLIAEQVIDLGYSTLVLDATGEHRHLEDIRGTLTLGGGSEPLPPPDRLGLLLSHRYGSLVLDLSLLPGAARHRYTNDVLAAVAAHRQRVGLPHWLVLEEAHVLAAPDGPGQRLLAGGTLGNCLVTYHPMELCPSVTDAIDVVIAAAGGTVDADQAVAYLAKVTGVEVGEVEQALAAMAPTRGLVVARREAPDRLLQVQVGGRRTPHVRHEQKYAEAELPHHLRFFFTPAPDGRAPVAANVGQLHDVLASCHPTVLAFHAGRHDLSKWVRGVLSDGQLAAEIADIEDTLDTPAEVDTVRHRLLRTIERRYL
jgi:hypothetical protein